MTVAQVKHFILGGCSVRWALGVWAPDQSPGETLRMTILPPLQRTIGGGGTCDFGPNEHSSEGFQ